MLSTVGKSVISVLSLVFPFLGCGSFEGHDQQLVIVADLPRVGWIHGLCRRFSVREWSTSQKVSQRKSSYLKYPRHGYAD